MSILSTVAQDPCPSIPTSPTATWRSLTFSPISPKNPRVFQGIPVDPLHGESYFQNYFSVTNPSETPDGPDADDD
jgi:hypothetical protein